MEGERERKREREEEGEREREPFKDTSTIPKLPDIDEQCMSKDTGSFNTLYWNMCRL